MPSRQPVHFRERVVDPLRVERPAPLEERVLVAERAVMRAAARHHDRVRNEIARATDQIAPDRRQVFQRTWQAPRVVPARHATPIRPEIPEESRESFFAGAEEDRVGVCRRLIRKARRVQASERDEDAACAERIRQSVGAMRIGDEDLDDDKVGGIGIGIDVGFDVLVDDPQFVAAIEVRGERRETQRRKQGVLDRSPERALRFRERGQNQ